MFIERYQPRLWLHGHVHHASDYQVGSCRVVCNPRGYPGAWVEGFQENQVIEVKRPGKITLNTLLANTTENDLALTKEDKEWLNDKPIGSEEI